MALIEQRSAHFDTWTARGLVNAVQTRLDLWKTRRALARLDAHLLKDIGVSAEEARREADLTIWDVPNNWTCH